MLAMPNLASAPQIFGSLREVGVCAGFLRRAPLRLHPSKQRLFTFQSGGRGRIRTHGCFHIGCFQDRCIRPLCHPSRSVTSEPHQPIALLSRALLGSLSSGVRHRSIAPYRAAGFLLTGHSGYFPAGVPGVFAFPVRRENSVSNGKNFVNLFFVKWQIIFKHKKAPFVSQRGR